MKDLLIEEGILKGVAPRPKSNESNDVVQNEMLARLIQLQQFVQGGHGSQSRSYQPSGALHMATDPLPKDSQGETSLYEEMRTIRQAQQAILTQIGGVAEATTQVATTVAEEPELKSLTLEGVSLTLKDVNLTLPSQERDKAREIARDKVNMSVDQRLADLQ